MQINFSLRFLLTGLCGIAMLLASPIQSQAQPDIKKTVRKQISALVDSIGVRLALSDSQKVELQKILTQYYRDSRDFIKNYRNDREILTLMHKNATDRRDHAIRDLLTPEQRKKFEYHKAAIIESIRKARKGEGESDQEAEEQSNTETEKSPGGKH